MLVKSKMDVVFFLERAPVSESKFRSPQSAPKNHKQRSAKREKIHRLSVLDHSLPGKHDIPYANCAKALNDAGYRKIRAQHDTALHAIES